jgi:soluble lytic murein transglycosylase-like protein
VDESLTLPRLAELELAFARSRRAAAAHRARAARRGALSRRVARMLALVVAALGAMLIWASAVATAPTVSPAPKGPRWTVARCPVAGRFLGAFRSASLDTTLPVSLLVAVAWEESRMNQHAVSSAGARGLLQLMPLTPGLVAVKGDGARANILAGARYLRRMISRFDGNLELALSAYNAGPTAVANAGAAPTIGTLRYAKNVELRAAQLQQCG